jgi:5-methyltetrahydrofolate--homocysteine methyltransferase
VNPSDFLDRLQQRAVLLDGGLGTLLMGLGLEAGRAPEWWNLEHPDRVREAHRLYVEAGSDVIHANTFGATPQKLAAAGLEGRCPEINAVGVRLAREAARSRALVAGDLGPTGRFLPPMGDATVEELAAGFGEQAAAILEAGADLISIETMYDLREALAAVRAALATGLPVLASMTFDVRPRGTFSMMGDALCPSLAALLEAGAHAVGFNCSVTSEAMVGMVREARESVRGPLVAQPNAGQPRPTPTGVVYDASPEAFASDLVQMVQAGARLVGGCCGTDPRFIRAAREALDRLDAP